MILNLGKLNGCSEVEIENLIEITKSEILKSRLELPVRFHQMYEIMKMVLVNGIIDSAEMRLATSLAIKLGFSENEISPLITILIHGIKKGEKEESILKVYCESLN